MIEVEKRFKLDESKLPELLKDFKFLGEKEIHDVYYEYPDYRMSKSDVWLRMRNGNWELKIQQPNGSRQEIENKKEIEKYFQTENLEQFLKDNMFIFHDYKVARKEYVKDDIKIDLDYMDFGYNVGEIEIMVEKDEDVEKANAKLIKFAEQNGLEIKNIPTKKKEYLRIKRPDIYKELYS